jgi:hypothetical protein
MGRGAYQFGFKTIKDSIIMLKAWVGAGHQPSTRRILPIVCGKLTTADELASTFNYIRTPLLAVSKDTFKAKSIISFHVFSNDIKT